jgi:NAD(P)-dependent dehydrogenase (short-subunit alcohol dehydrogenase family)
MNPKQCTAIVTGGASGLGEATVRKLVSLGAKAAILDRDTAKGGALADELGPGVIFCEADVTDEGSVQSAIQEAGNLGALRIAVNCAGVGWAQRVVDRSGSPHSLDAFRKVVEINLIGTFNVMRLAAASMASLEPDDGGERGVIVNTASVAAYEGQIGQIAYAASKGGVVSLTLPAARDLSSSGIRVVTIAPGTFDTPMIALLPQQATDALVSHIPFPKRLGAPQEFADLVAHIVENPYLNGETIRLDGAIRMPPKN